MAVPANWRLVIENLTGVTINAFLASPFDGVEASLSGTIIGPTDNSINPQGEITLTNASSILNANFGDLTPDHDNATDRYEQVDGNIKVKVAGAANGDVKVYLNLSASGITQFSDNSPSALIWLKTIPFTAAATKTESIRF